MKRRCHQWGATLVEFALCFIVFVMICMAIIDFGRYMLTLHHLNLIAAEAARIGITGQRFERNTGTVTVSLNRDQSIRVAAIEAANRLSGSFGNLGKIDLGTVAPYSPKNITIEHASSDNSFTNQNLANLSWSTGPGKYDDLVRITVSTDFQWLTPMMKWIGSSTTMNKISAVSVQRNRGDEDQFTTD